MYKSLFILLAITLSVLTGCKKEAPLIQATIGNAGSISGNYGIRDVSIQTTGGGWTGFGYGGVNGYPGASADIGKMGVPAHIKGTWRKGRSDKGETLTYYRIDAPIDSDLAEQKMRTLQNYYDVYTRNYASMQVVVDEERIQVMYTLGCYSKLNNCEPKEEMASNDWVVMNPSGTTEVVVLFDGKGESSPVPFED